MFSSLKFYIFSSFINFLTNFLLAIFILLKNRKIPTNRYFAYFTLCVSFWSLFYFKWLSTTNQIWADYFVRTCMIGVLLMPSTFMQFAASLVKIKMSPWIHRINYFISIIGIFFVYTPLFAIPGDSFYVFPYWPRPGPLFHLFLLHFSINTIFGHVLFINKYFKTQDAMVKNQILYILLAGVFGFLGGSVNFLPWYRISILPISTMLVSLWTILPAYAIIKHHLMNIRVAITRAGVALTIYTLSLGVPFYLGYKTNSWFLSTSSAILLVLPAPFFYRTLFRKAKDIILAQQRHYQKILVQAARGMVTVHSLEKLTKLIVYVIKMKVKLKYAAIFVYQSENKLYLLKAQRPQSAISKDKFFSEETPLITHLKEYPYPQIREELPLSLREHLEGKLGGKLVGLVVPSVMNRRLLGFLVLGEKLNREAYSPDDIEVFKILAYQGALAMEHCLFLEEFKRNQQRLFQVEKLASIGGMAEGVAHQIKNRLNQFSIVGGELKISIKDFLEENPYIREDARLGELFQHFTRIADSLLDNVKRTNGVVRGILEYAQGNEAGISFEWCNLSEMIDAAIKVVAVKQEVDGLPIEVDLEEVKYVWGVRSQLQEVFCNLIDNAYEATEMLKEVLSPQEKEKFSPQIKIKGEDRVTFFAIEISDNGIGIKEEDKNKIFAPFFTTKSSYKSGSGIGMYVVRRIIEENHKGEVKFKSEYKRGTTFYINLPKPKESFLLNQKVAGK